MENNGDARQYVSYTASNCTVTATYEYQNRMYVYLKRERENLTPNQISMMREIAKEFKNEQEEL